MQKHKNTRILLLSIIFFTNALLAMEPITESRNVPKSPVVVRVGNESTDPIELVYPTVQQNKNKQGKNELTRITILPRRELVDDIPLGNNPMIMKRGQRYILSTLNKNLQKEPNKIHVWLAGERGANGDREPARFITSKALLRARVIVNDTDVAIIEENNDLLF